MPRQELNFNSQWPSLTFEGNLILPEVISEIANLSDDKNTREKYGIRKGLSLRDELSASFRVGQANYNEYANQESISNIAINKGVAELLSETFAFKDLKPANESITFLAGERAPVLVVPASEENLDARSKFVSQDGKFSPAFALQNYLNEREESLWGLVTNGNIIRLIRDNDSLTQPAYIEANLSQIFENDDIASFAVLWPLIHRNMFGFKEGPIFECPLEQLREKGITDGVAIREKLAGQVQNALKLLGTGFIVANPPLLEKLRSGEISMEDWLNELLRLVYRLIFLMVAEDRQLLHPENISQNARDLYLKGYSITLLRNLCIRRTAWDNHHDKYELLKIVFMSLSAGEKNLGLTALGGLFTEDLIPNLNKAKLRNRMLMEVIYKLSYQTINKQIVPINWRMMKSEELGSVYESLLDLQPVISENDGIMSFSTDSSGKGGNQRRKTGSYYTPDSLVQIVLNSALDPILDKTEKSNANPENAIRNLKVIDPACGSGHFLLGASQRMATRLARIRCQGSPNASEYRTALRDITQNCIFGVDMNPMAVELTKVALWIETVEPGKPLSFYDSQILCGNSLIGVFKQEDLMNGIPDKAYEPLPNDSKRIANYYENLNKREKSGQGILNFEKGGGQMPAMKPLFNHFTKLRKLPQNDYKQVYAIKQYYSKIRESKDYKELNYAANIWTAAFLTPKTGNIPISQETRHIPTTDDMWITPDNNIFRPKMYEAIEIANSAGSFHWFLEFLDIMQEGGFDVILGNPPWERIKVQDSEFFTNTNYEIAKEKYKPERTRLINELEMTNPQLFKKWKNARYLAQAYGKFIKFSKRFPFGSAGDINTYAVFSDLFKQLLNANGQAGFIVPLKLVTGLTYINFLKDLRENKSLVSFFGFINSNGLFKSVHRDTKFGLLTISGKNIKTELPKLSAQLKQVSDLQDESKIVTLSGSDIEQINPITENMPIFATKTDAKITLSITSNSGILVDKPAINESQSGWNSCLLPTFHMTTEANSFIKNDDIQYHISKRDSAMAIMDNSKNVYPLYEGKMISLYDHRFGTYENRTEKNTNQNILPHVSDRDHSIYNHRIEPRFWVDSEIVNEKLKQIPNKYFYSCRVEGPGERTLVGTITPRAGYGNSMSVLTCQKNPNFFVCLVSILCSFVADYAVRQQSTKINQFILRQIPILTTEQVQQEHQWLGTNFLNWVAYRVLELCYTNIELMPLANDLGRNHLPFHWNPERRKVIQAEIDATIMHLFNLDRENVEWILDSFSTLRTNEIAKFNKFHTKQLILEEYDRISNAKKNGNLYKTTLNTPPGDKLLCHK